MNSRLDKRVLVEWLKVAEKSECNEILLLAKDYIQYLKDDKDEEGKVVYAKLVEKILYAQSKYNMTFMESPDGSYNKAITVLAFMAEEAYAKKKNQSAMSSVDENKTYRIDFESVESANAWLRGKTGVDVISIEPETHTRIGLFAHHTTVSKVHMSYKINQNTNYYYQILEEEITSLFIRKKSDAVLSEWKDKHPGYEVVQQKFYMNSRASSSSSLFGFGLDYIEHVKTVTLYRVKKGGMQ